VRIQTYDEELARLRFTRDPALCRAGEMTVDDGYRAVGEVLALADPPTAIIAGNNQLFAGLFAAIRDLGLRIPGDLSVVACEETELTMLHNPPLDVVRRDMDELGTTAAELLLERLDAPRRRPRQVVLPTTFEARGSSAAPASRRTARA
jgi:DNA-binding LacI/PurR family transcriptional regulator